MKNKIIKISTLLLFANLLFVITANYSIEKNARAKTFDDFNNFDKRKVGLVLGTSKYLKSGHVNPYFKYRIDAATELFENKKVDFILISGDNGSKFYDEPTAFKNELIKRGIPENRIYLDYAGFRTLDSVVRAKEIFGQTELIVISQKFHNERAIYLAEKNGISAIGYNAKDVSKRFGLKVQLREYLARTKMFLDILVGVKPKFLGEKILIE